MSKGLRALERIVELAKYDVDLTYDFEDLQIDKETIEKELKALEIIKEKNIDLMSLRHAFTMDKEGEQSGYEWYNNLTLVKRGVYDTLTQEEYDLLKEVLL